MTPLFYIFLLTHFGVTGSLIVGVGDAERSALQGGSLVMQLLQGSAGAYSLYCIFSSRRALTLLKRCLPLFFLSAIALSSAIWSIDPSITIRRSINLTVSFLLGIALVGRLGSQTAIHLTARIMSLACILSVAAVFAIPSIGVHQADDSFQVVHAGLWRGLLAHKVSLGVFAGLTIGLLVFFGVKTFTNPLFYAIALMAAAACLIGSGSATGIAAMALLTAFLVTTSVSRAMSASMRSLLFTAINTCAFAMAALMLLGQIERFAFLLGRSGDLTGRTTYWPHVEAFINAHGYYLGFGYGAGFKVVGPLIKASAGMELTEAHNGILELVIGVGHVGMVLVMSMIAWFMLRSSRIARNVEGPPTKVRCFPFALLVTLLVVSYAESIILSFNGIWSILFSLAIAVLHAEELKIEEDRLSEDASQVFGGRLLETDSFEQPAE